MAAHHATINLFDADGNARRVRGRLAGGDFLVSHEAVTEAALALRDGRLYGGGSESLLALSATAGLRATLQNPAGSGRAIMVAHLVLHNAGSLLLALPVLVNPSGNLPARPAEPTNLSIGGPPPAGLLKIDTGPAMTGGVRSSLVLTARPGDRTVVSLPAPVRVPPGVTLGLGVPPEPGLASLRAALNVYWWEEDL